MSQQELVNYYNDPRVRAILGVVRDAEGTSRYGDAYRVAGGGKVTLSSLNNPTFHRWKFKYKDGREDVSTATGAYQFLQDTWGELQGKYGFKDFSPYTQDLAAIALLKRAGAMPYIQRGDYFGALRAAKGTWASLPGAGYNQQERKYDFLKQSLEKHLGKPLDMHAQTIPVDIQPQQQPTQPQTPVMMGDISPQVNDPYAKLFNIQPDEIDNTGAVEYDNPIQLHNGVNNDNPFLLEI